MMVGHYGHSSPYAILRDEPPESGRLKIPIRAKWVPSELTLGGVRQYEADRSGQRRPTFCIDRHVWLRVEYE
jgi:hypothetical protein